ncbi:MAG: tetratricopeptide repeat protein [Bdellovibrionota bacterium]
MKIEDIKKKYLDEELDAIYSLGLAFIENGDCVKARNIFEGLIEVDNTYLPGIQGMIYLEIEARDFQDAIKLCQKALELEPNSYEVMLMYVSCLISIEDYSKAGTYLGEISDAIEDRLIDDYDIIRFYKSQIIRYQNLSSLRPREN